MAKSPDVQRIEILTAIGDALSAWSGVESALDWLFAALSEAPLAKAHVVMASVRSFGARIQICNNLVAMDAVLPAVKNEWSPLYNRLTKKNDKRNEIAHFSIHLVPVGKDVEFRLKPYASQGAQVLETHKAMAKGRGTKLGEGTLSVQVIQERAESFRTLAQDIAKFETYWGQQRKQFREDYSSSHNPAPKP